MRCSSAVAADQRIEQAVPRAIGQVDAVGRQRIARGRRFFLAGADAGALAGRARRDDRRLGDAVRDELEDVEPRDALLAEQDRRMGLRLLQDRRQHVAGMHFVALRALHVEHGRLQHAAERRGLLRLALVAARQLLDRFVEVVVQLAAQRREIGAAGLENPLAVGVVQQRVEQVLERQVRVPPRDGFAIRDVKDGFDRCGEHEFRL